MTIVSRYAEVLILFGFLLTAAVSLIFCLYRRRRETQVLMAEKNLLYSSPASIPSNRFVIPLKKLSSRVPSTISDVTPMAGTVPELFRLHLIYRLNYSFLAHSLLFQVVRLTPMQSVLEECFTSFVCQVRLFTSAEHEQSFMKDPHDECFRFRLDPSHLLTSYLKVRIFAQDRTARRLELGQTIFVINQDEERQESPLLSRFIQIYENIVELLTRYQVRKRTHERGVRSVPSIQSSYFAHK